MKLSICILAAGIFLFALQPALGSQPTTHVITFGGAVVGRHYSPSQLTIEVGDTIVWSGDFSPSTGYPMDSLIFPGDAPTFSQITSGNTFTYVIVAPGNYFFANKTWLQLGMSGTINAVFKSHGSLTNEGREFYLGMIYPSYESVTTASLRSSFNVFALIASYYKDTIFVSYYDSHGFETTPTRYVIPARGQLQIKLDTTTMHIPLSQAETALYAACHIVSKFPITVHYLSRGCNSGGSYLALPVLGLGKNYVAASYNDNGIPPAGALYGSNGLPSLAKIDISAGSFLIIATEDNTNVNIIPAATTTGGHARNSNFSIGLSKGQAFYVRSNGSDQSHDMSGSVIQSTGAPIVVISGHEDAYLGDISCAASEGRNLLIQQMTPVEYWDTNGFMGIPFAEGNKGTSTCGGQGDDYRTYTFGASSAKIQADVYGVAGGYNLSTSQLNYGEKSEIAASADIYSTNGHKISVMQYDERTHPQFAPDPAPSMMTIVPHSRWRYSYNFPEFDPSGIGGSFEGQYINVISDSIQTVKVSTSGSADAPITNALVGGKLYKNISSTFTSSTGQVFALSASHTFFMHSNYPFIAYLYGMNSVSASFGMFQNNDFHYEYATPAGMQLNTGTPPAFKVKVTDLPNCAGWNVCVTDTSSGNPGVKLVTLADDPDGVYFQRPGIAIKNAVLDPSDTGYTMISPNFTDSTHAELHPNRGSNAYCFNVLRPNKLAETKAPVGIIDNNGNGLLIQLYKSAPTIQLATAPATLKPDSIVFPSQAVGVQVCTTFVVTNTAPLGGSGLVFTNVKLLKGDAAFSIQTITPALPAMIKPLGTLTVTVCANLPDTKRHLDSLIISNDCFDVPISLDAHGSIGNIVAGDIAFGNLDSGQEICKTLIIQNTGSSAFTLTTSPTLSDNVNFAVDPTFLASLPLTIMVGGHTGTIKVCYHPHHVGSDSATITWKTDIDAGFSSTKRYSTLTGAGLSVNKGIVNGNNLEENTFSVRPNPAPGNTAIVSLSLPSKASAMVSILDVLGRELYTQRYATSSGEFEIPIGFLTQGIYYVRLTSEDVVLTQKLEVVR